MNSPGAFINLAYFATAVLFIVGLKRMASPKTAKSGILWAGIGMVVATVVTLGHPHLGEMGFFKYFFLLLAIAIGGGAAWISGKRVAMTDMPQMIALYNGMGGGAAGAIAAVELAGSEHHGGVALTLAVLGAIIGSVSFSGSLIAFGKLQELIKKPVRFPNQHLLNLGLFAVTALLGVYIVASGGEAGGFCIAVFFLLALALGVSMTLPIGGADMPVVISLYNALTGLAVAFEGYVLNNAAMIIAGTVVGAAGTLLTQLMAKAMNRPITNVLFSNFGATGEAASVGESGGTLKTDRTVRCRCLDGLCQQGHHRARVRHGRGPSPAQGLGAVPAADRSRCEREIRHPSGRGTHARTYERAAGRSGGALRHHLRPRGNQFGVPDGGCRLGHRRERCGQPDGADQPESPIYGMPILNVDQAKNVLVIKRGKGTGFSGIENALFTLDNTRMLYGDGQEMASQLIATIKEV